MFKNISFLLVVFLYITLIGSALCRTFTSDDQSIVDSNEIISGPDFIEEGEQFISTMETNVEVNQNYLECDNINSEVDKLTANYSAISNQSCDSVYRFPSFRIIYEVNFKNGLSAQMEIELDVQDNEPYPDKSIVTLTGRVVDGYMKGAHFQNVIIYPVLNDINSCWAGPGITELQSTSASVTFILLPMTTEDKDFKSFRAIHLPEAFDCFGNVSIKYTPVLLNLSSTQMIS